MISMIYILKNQFWYSFTKHSISIYLNYWELFSKGVTFNLTVKTIRLDNFDFFYIKATKKWIFQNDEIQLFLPTFHLLDGKLNLWEIEINVKTCHDLTASFSSLLCILQFSYFLGNGFIEGQELDGFLREFVTSVNTDDVEVSLLLVSSSKD